MSALQLTYPHHEIAAGAKFTKNKENDMILDTMILGSQKLIPIEIEATGFSMDSNPWSVRCSVGAMSARCNTTKIDGSWYFIFDTTRLKAGRCFIVAEYSIPDENFASGYRVEVWQDELTYLEDKK